ncbi:hypothetical protein DRJ17_01900 [Candidatus Woesearchaeota archaeon]|nr:MAG: hypothetical protein DRJ17_01900 [Candidatus Woesearchaeota archaeon]
MKIELNIEKKHLYLIVVIIILIGALMFVVAYNTGYQQGDPVPRTDPAPSVMGHTVDEIAGLREYIISVAGGDGGLSNVTGGWETIPAAYYTEEQIQEYFGSAFIIEKKFDLRELEDTQYLYTDTVRDGGYVPCDIHAGEASYYYFHACDPGKACAKPGIAILRGRGEGTKGKCISKEGPVYIIKYSLPAGYSIDQVIPYLNVVTRIKPGFLIKVTPEDGVGEVTVSYSS